MASEESATQQFGKVTHCLFDLDGLLLDTETIYAEITQRIAKEYKKPFLREIHFLMSGSSEVRAAQLAVEGMRLPLSNAEFMRKFQDMSKKMVGNCHLMKGAERLVKHLNNSNIPIALATGSDEAMLKLKIQKYSRVFDLFNHIVHGSDPEVKEAKPAPDVFLVAAARFPEEPSPVEVLVFEDSTNGVRAAKLAGMQTVMVPDPLLPDNLRKDATLVLKSLLDFKPEVFGLPPFPPSTTSSKK